MKKIYCSFLIIFFALLSGCGRMPKIGICVRNADAGVTVQMMEKLEDALQAQACRVQTANAVNDQARQNGQVSACLDSGCDLLIVEPVITEEAHSIASMAQQAQVPLIFLNYAPPEAVLEEGKQVCYIGSDLSSPGTVLQELLRGLPCENLRYLIISGPQTHVDASAWTQACRQTQQGNCLGIEYGDWSRQSGKRIAGQFLSRHTETADVFVCMGDEMALGALEAAGEMEEDIFVLGVGGQRQALLQVAEGNLFGTVCPDISALTSSVCQAVQCYFAGETPPKWTQIDFVPITKENVQDFL